MAHLVEQDVNILVLDCLQEVVWTQFLAPVAAKATHLTFEAIIEPQANVVAAVCTAWARVKIICVIEMSSAVAGCVAFWHSVGICASVDIDI